MSTEQIALLAQVVTLLVLAASIIWGTVQRGWQAADIRRNNEKVEQDRQDAAVKLEQDRILLAAELEHRRVETAQTVADALEKRATEIRQALDEQARVITERQERLVAGLAELNSELQGNTALTKHAADQAAAAYKEANDVNIKIAGIGEANLAAALGHREQGESIRNTGEDTLKRVKRVEDATVQTDAQVASGAKETERRLTQLEDQKSDDVKEAASAVARQTRRMVETGEDSNQRIRNVESVLEDKDGD